MNAPPEPPPDPQTRPRPSLDELRDLGRLRRTTKAAPEGRRIAGVAGGLARHLDVDPLVLRVALVVAVFFGGAGLIVYAAAWLLLPEDGATDAIIPLDVRVRTVLLWVAAGVAGLSLLGDTLGGLDVPWVWVVVGVALVGFYGSRGKWALWHTGHTSGAGGVAGGRGGTAGPVNLSKDTDATVDEEALARLHGWLGDTTPPPPPTVPTTRQRHRPVLAGFAVALAALLCGVLGLVDGAGATIPPSAYPALVLTIFAGFLVIGAFWGRATGLVALSIIPLLILAGTTVTRSLDVQGRDLSLQPHSAAELAPAYHFQAGEIRIDLSRISPKELDGRHLAIDGTVGQIVVIVPDDVGVEATATVGGPGEVDVLGGKEEGIGGSSLSRASSGGDPTMTIDADVEVGAIRIYSESDHEAARWQRQIQRDIKHDAQRGANR